MITAPHIHDHWSGTCQRSREVKIIHSNLHPCGLANFPWNLELGLLVSLVNAWLRLDEKLSKQANSQRELKRRELWTQGSLGECFVLALGSLLGWLVTNEAPLGGIYTCPLPQWTVEIYLILRWRFILQNTPYKYLRYLQAYISVELCRRLWGFVEPSRTWSREIWRNPGRSRAARDILPHQIRQRPRCRLVLAYMTPPPGWCPLHLVGMTWCVLLSTLSLLVPASCLPLASPLPSSFLPGWCRRLDTHSSLVPLEGS